MRRTLNLILLLSLVGCAQASPAGPGATASPTALVAAAPSVAPTVPRPPTAAPSLTPPPPSATPTATIPPPSPTPDPVAGLTIPDLRALEFGAGEITVGELWQRGAGYTSYRISYPAGDLRLTGLIHIPDGEGPFPVIIANRGTISREIYQPGMDSRAFSDLMANNGYLVIAPDFRGYAGGDDGPNPFYTGFYIDVLALIPLAQRLPQARPGKLGMWGHSRGASVTVAALTISDQIAAAVVYAPAPAYLAEDYWRRFRNTGGNPGGDTWIFTPDQDPAAYRRISPITYFDAVDATVQLHHGDADTTVDSSASAAIAAELRAQGKDVTLHIYEGQGHALQGAAYDLYAQRTLEFFAEHLKK